MPTVSTSIESTHAQFVSEFRLKWDALRDGVALFRTGKPAPPKRDGYLELTYHIDYREGREDWLIRAMATDLAQQLARQLVEFGGPISVGGLEFQYDQANPRGTKVLVGWNVFEPEPDPWVVVAR